MGYYKREKYKPYLPERMSLNDIKKRLGDEIIIRQFDFDLERIKEFLQMMVKGNISSYLREYRNVIRDIKELERNGKTFKMLVEDVQRKNKKVVSKKGIEKKKLRILE